jgi:hypothetical protein
MEYHYSKTKQYTFIGHLIPVPPLLEGSIRLRIGIRSGFLLIFYYCDEV